VNKRQKFFFISVKIGSQQVNVVITLSCPEICRKFGVVCGKNATVCPSPTLLAHDAALLERQMQVPGQTKLTPKVTPSLLLLTVCVGGLQQKLVTH